MAIEIEKLNILRRFSVSVARSSWQFRMSSCYLVFHSVHHYHFIHHYLIQGQLIHSVNFKNAVRKHFFGIRVAMHGQVLQIDAFGIWQLSIENGNLVINYSVIVFTVSRLLLLSMNNPPVKGVMCVNWWINFLFNV